MIDGKVVATHERFPARRPEKLLLWVDDENVALKADASDFVTIVAAVADGNGTIKRLNNYYVKFHVEGEGRILGNAGVLANPAPIKWGTAPALIQSTLKPGKIKVSASVLFEGSQMPVSAVLELESVAAEHPLVYSEKEDGTHSSLFHHRIGRRNCQIGCRVETRTITEEVECKKAERGRKAARGLRGKEITFFLFRIKKQESTLQS